MTAVQKMRAGLCGLLLVLVLPGLAEARNPYEVTGVRVDATAKSASQARDIAIRQGIAKAFRMLVSRSVTASDAARVPTPAQAELDSMVASFGVDKEKTSSTRYLAELTVAFKPDAVRNVFLRSGVQYSESLSQPVLVIPVWISPEGIPQLWGGDNPWMQGWQPLTNAREAIVPVVLPKGSQEDMMLVGVEEARAPVQDRLLMLARNYRLDRVAVMQATPAPPASDGSTVVNVDVLMLDGREEERFSKRIEARLTGSPKDLEPVARAVQSTLAEQWKSRTLVTGGYEEALRASVPIVSLDQWIGVEERLRKVPSVSSVNVDAVGPGGAAVTLTYRGSLNQLTLSLRENDLILDRGPSGGYRILSRELR